MYKKMKHWLKSLLLLCFLSPVAWASSATNVPILLYHSFSATTPGSMTMNTNVFEQQLRYLKDNGFTVIPLQELVSYLQGKTNSLPAKPVVITADDGRKSVYTDMYPLVKKYNVPVTLFIYPSSISNASYAMTWDELKQLQKTGLFDIQGHTYWHPNFKQEKKKQSAADYQKFVQTQLVKSKQVLETKLNTHVTLLAWPFGIYDNDLEQQAASAGYTMAFTIDGRPANRSEKAMAQPRYMIVADENMQTFAAIVNGNANVKKVSE